MLIAAKVLMHCTDHAALSGQPLRELPQFNIKVGPAGPFIAGYITPLDLLPRIWNILGAKLPNYTLLINLLDGNFS